MGCDVLWPKLGCTSSRTSGTARYIGVTKQLGARIWQHQAGEGSSFCKRYGLAKLVWYEHHPLVADAIQRETSLKRWPRKWKLELIEKANPQWLDLSMQLLD